MKITTKYIIQKSIAILPVIPAIYILRGYIIDTPLLIFLLILWGIVLYLLYFLDYIWRDHGESKEEIPVYSFMHVNKLCDNKCQYRNNIFNSNSH